MGKKGNPSDGGIRNATALSCSLPLSLPDGSVGNGGKRRIRLWYEDVQGTVFVMNGHG